MKIHFPLLGFNLSGGIRVIVTLANGLVERGHEVRVTVPAFRAESPFPLHPKVDLAVSGTARDSRIGYWRKLKDEAADWGDVLVATNFKTPLILSKSIRKKKSNARLLYYIQGYEPISQGKLGDGPLPKRILNRHLALRSYRYTRNRIYVSRFVASRVGLDPDPFLVHPGVDTTIFKPTALEERVPTKVGVIWSPHRLKGFHDFATAWEGVVEKCRHAEAAILHTGDYKGPKVSRSTLHTTSNDSELATYYRDVDVFVFPSHFEGFGLPPLEAMACGTPSVITDCGGVSEFAINRSNSLVVPPGDPESLRDAILELLDPDGPQDSLRANGLETASRFSWEETVTRFEEAMTAIEIS